MIWRAEKSGLIVINDEEMNEDSIAKIKEKNKAHIGKLKINKTVLLSIILITITSLCTGIGTYSWFVSSAASSINSITVGTFKLSLDAESASNVPIDMGNIEPGYITDKWQTVYFINAGTLDMILKGQLNITSKLFKSDDTHIGAYKVIARIYKYDSGSKETNFIFSNETNGETMSSFNDNLNNKLCFSSSSVVFKPGDKLKCEFKLFLDKELGTIDYQGDTLTGNFLVKARQNVEGATFGE